MITYHEIKGAGSLGGKFVEMDIGSEDRLALHNLQIPVGSINRTVSKWIFPRCSPTKQRLTASRRYTRNRNSYQKKKYTRCPPSVSI